METIVPLEISPAHYISEAVNVFCSDCRFANKLYPLFFEHEGYQNPDRVFVAGGAKKLSSPANEGERQSTLEDILDLLKLHHCHRVNLGVHAGCGKYGKKFETEEEETLFFQGELLKAREKLQNFLRKNDYEAETHVYFCDWKGMHEVKGPAL